MTVARLTQEATEALSTVAPNARLSQETVEALSAGNASARLSQQAVEVLSSGALVVDALLSQAVIEVLNQEDNVHAVLTQTVSEVLTVVDPAVRLTGLVIETLSSRLAMRRRQVIVNTN